MSKDEESRGVLYVATGKKYIDSAIHSARSVRKHNPELAIHLFSNWEEYGFDFRKSPVPFTSFDTVDSPHHHSKVDYSMRTPYDRTLFLDADTIVLGDINSLFDLLDRFDIALAHAPNRTTRLNNWKFTVPVSFPQFNTGVMVYNRSEKVMKFLQDWIEAYYQAGFRSDQITFRELIWLSDLRVATLPPEYNLRQMKYLLLWGKREAKPKILHPHQPLFTRGPLWILKYNLKVLLRRAGFETPKEKSSKNSSSRGQKI